MCINEIVQRCFIKNFVEVSGKRMKTLESILKTHNLRKQKCKKMNR